MPRQYTRTFRVRHYECDPYNHLNNVNYVRFMQEAALDASADVGWPTKRYTDNGTGWLVRETQVEYLRPIMQGQTVNITTWMEDVRRVRSQRRYEFRLEGEEELAASASTEWVYLDLEKQMPIHVPDDIILAYMPEGAPKTSRARNHFPTLPPQPEGVYRARHHVAWRDLDMIGHMNNATYLEYFEDAAAQVGSLYGWPVTRLIERGLAMVLRKMHIQYLRPALINDEIEVTTWFSHAERFRVRRHFAMHRCRDHELLAQATSLWVSIDLERQRPTRMLAEYIDAFAPNGAITS